MIFYIPYSQRAIVLFSIVLLYFVLYVSSKFTFLIRSLECYSNFGSLRIVDYPSGPHMEIMFSSCKFCVRFPIVSFSKYSCTLNNLDQIYLNIYFSSCFFLIVVKLVCFIILDGFKYVFILCLFTVVLVNF